ncbi:MAG: sigma-70 family RNA polymerase sigma factor [Gemmatimonadetes bacterium]|nr:sigma-70 family RNA polymerase sigma factor [Gemmatimonadota bacterium]
MTSALPWPPGAAGLPCAPLRMRDRLMQHGAALDAVAHTATDRPMTDRSSAPHDIDLVQQMARGDDRALGLLYDRFGVVLYAVAFRVVGQAADAEEVVMEAFAQAWREAPRFDAARGSVAAWLTVMARSRALDLVRAQSRRARATDSAARDTAETAPAMSAGFPPPGSGLEREERSRAVSAALATLSPPQRTAIELAYYDGLSQSEIAERLQEPLGTVKTRMRLGMLKLREALRPYYFEGAV